MYEQQHNFVIIFYIININTTALHVVYYCLYAQSNSLLLDVLCII